MRRRPVSRGASSQWLVLGTVVAVAGAAILILLAIPSQAPVTGPPDAGVRIPDYDVSTLSPVLANRLVDRVQFVRTNPDSADAWGTLGLTFDAHELAQAAIECYDHAADLDTGDFRWPYYQGVVQAPTDAAAGLRLLERAYNLRPDHEPLLVHLGRVCMALDQTEDATFWFNRALTFDADTLGAHLGLGSLALADGADEEAVEHLERALELNPSTGEVAFQLAAAYRRLGRTDEADAMFALAEGRGRAEPVHDPLRFGELAELGVTIRWRHIRAREAEVRGDLDRVIAEWRSAVRAEPESTTAMAELGEALARAERYEEALDVLRRALRNENAPPNVPNNVGQVLVALQRYDEAVDYFRSAMEGLPQNALVRQNLILSLLRAGRTAEALEVLDTSITLTEPDDPELLRFGALYAEAGHPERAEALYRAMIEADPDLYRARFELGSVYASLGRFDEAIASYRTVVERTPERALGWNGLAAVQAQSGDFASAVATLRAGLQLHPDDANLLRQAATILATHPDDRIRNGGRAHEFAARLVQKHGANLTNLQVLAAACAEIGLYSEAVHHSRRILAGLQGAGADPALIAQAQERLRLYRSNRPLRLGE